jgi:hypothetical protein
MAFIKYHVHQYSSNKKSTWNSSIKISGVSEMLRDINYLPCSFAGK